MWIEASVYTNVGQSMRFTQAALKQVLLPSLIRKWQKIGRR